MLPIFKISAKMLTVKPVHTLVCMVCYHLPTAVFEMCRNAFETTFSSSTIFFIASHHSRGIQFLVNSELELLLNSKEFKKEWSLCAHFQSKWRTVELESLPYFGTLQCKYQTNSTMSVIPQWHTLCKTKYKKVLTLLFIDARVFVHWVDSQMLSIILAFSWEGFESLVCNWGIPCLP
jgi:hypothetical protein